MDKHLNLYKVNLQYNKELGKIDKNVMSNSAREGKQNRPYIGVLVLINGKEYVAPISSKKPKSANLPNKNFDHLKITDKHNGVERIIAIINFNNMIPVSRSVIELVNIKPDPKDTLYDKNEKILLTKELDWCRTHSDKIQKNAQKTYDMIVSGKANASLKRRCCDFIKLEGVLRKILDKNQQKI